MAYTAGNLALMNSVNGFSHYRYDSTDAATTVDGNGYFNNTDDTLKLRVGDLITVFVWATAVRTGTVSDVSMHAVMQVSAAGVVDLSDDLLGATVTTGD